MDNFPASEFMTEFEIAEIDNETYENNIRRLFQLRQAREEQEVELNRQKVKDFSYKQIKKQKLKDTK